LNLFYTPDIATGIYSLNEEESRHCRIVLRSVNGDIVHLTNGAGTLFECRIIDAKSKLVTVEVIGRQEEFGKKTYRLHLAVAPTKNIDRFEWFLEKATEIGIDEITPLICEHSERRQLRVDRLQKIITAAVKQSLKAYHPVLKNIMSFNEFISQAHEGNKLIAHLEGSNPVLLRDAYHGEPSVTILVGPEGDFSQPEISAAKDNGFHCVSLGNSRFRTETAAVLACHSVYFQNQ
jgi:16S rRNA (uracil1498-N3)-methyltransferase